MRVLHLAAGNRWTGAAAPAFAEVEALRLAGIEAHYAYVGGYKLQEKIGGLAYAHPLIEKAQNPRAFASSLRALERVVREHRIDVLHAHLTYDHWLARFVAGRTGAALVRTFHSRRTLRRDPFTRFVVRQTDAICVVNSTFVTAPLIRAKSPAFTPPPLDDRLFTADGADVREAYGVGRDEQLLVTIGKLSAGRGFEEALATFAAVLPLRPKTRLMIIGHGEHRPVLERRAADLGIGRAVIWAGYHETDLPEHYRAADAMLFTAQGSDEGHRAVLEAMGCGVPPVSYPIPGVDALLGPLAATQIAADPDAHSLADRVVATLDAGRQSFRPALADRSVEFNLGGAATRLAAVYSGLKRV